MTSIKITFSDDDVVPQQVPKSQNASHIGSDVSTLSSDVVFTAVASKNDDTLCK